MKRKLTFDRVDQDGRELYRFNMELCKEDYINLNKLRIKRNLPTKIALIRQLIREEVLQCQRPI